MKFNFLLIFLAVTVLFVSISCDDDDDDEKKSSTDSKMDVVVLSKQVLPVVAPTKGENEWGGQFYKTNIHNIYKIFKEPVVGKDDGQNIYMSLGLIQNFADFTFANAEILDTPKAYKPCYDFNDTNFSETTYTHFADEKVDYKRITGAYKEVDGVIDIVIGATHIENGNSDNVYSMQAKYNKNTGDLIVNSIYHINYLAGSSMAGSDYGVYSKISGNVNTGKYSCHVQVGSGSASASDVVIISKGISKGTGYYVCYLNNKYNSTATPAGYYKFLASENNESAMKAYDASNKQPVPYTSLTGDTENYGKEIETYKTALTTPVLVFNHASFANSGLIAK